MDAAGKNFGHYWTVPTRGLMQELIDECHWEWKCEEGKEGYNVVGKNGNSMFLPVINSKKNMEAIGVLASTKKVLDTQISYISIRRM